MMWEYSFLRWIIENLQTPFITWIMKIITVSGEGAGIFFLISVIMLFFRKTRKAGFVIIAGLVIVAGFNNYGLKYIVARKRPFMHPGLSVDATWLATYVQNFALESKFNDFLVPSSFAFASGHTLSAFIFGFIISYYHRKVAIPALIFSSLMAFSRMYLGFHYPTDVIAGVIWAAFTALGFIFIADYYEKAFIRFGNRVALKFKKKEKEEPHE